jgi:sugar O-acyltransferase (sialic acid O-acetyltransferase NeuD family)
MAGVLVVIGDRTAEEYIEAAVSAMKAGQLPEMRIDKLFFDSDKFTTDDSRRFGKEVRYIVGIADEEWKRRVVEACEALGWSAQAIVHPAAVVAASAKVGAGAFVGPLAVLSSHAEIGEHALVHLHASAGHDCRVGDYSVVLPGARLSGNVCVGDGVVVGSNAFVGAGVRIGDGCRIDAQSYVTHDVPEGFLVSPRLPRPVKRVY